MPRALISVPLSGTDCAQDGEVGGGSEMSRCVCVRARVRAWGFLQLPVVSTPKLDSLQGEVGGQG